MDSSSIVCMADAIVARGLADCPGLDTISFYSDCEPNWDERPYFTKVEERRGRAGTHIDVGSQASLKLSLENGSFVASPGTCCRPASVFEQVAACITSHGNRVVVSGIGGDESTGGVPTPTPELGDLVVRGDCVKLVRQLKSWALHSRRPWLRLVLAVIREFLPEGLRLLVERRHTPVWLDEGFAGRNRAALCGYPCRLRLLSGLPSFQENLRTLNALRRQLCCDVLPSGPVHEKRFPYLDRDFLEFMYAVPREQVVRPDQRRSLMRRALKGIVPPGVLQRRRKATAFRGPLAALALSFPELAGEWLSTDLRIIDVPRLSNCLQQALNGEPTPIVSAFRALELESWLRTLRRCDLLRGVPRCMEDLPPKRVFNRGEVRSFGCREDPAGW